ncbi:MAG: Asp23/Gls24 family envelope stress response protein [Anaerovorax sp.]
MSTVLDDKLGILKISDEVIARYVTKATLFIEGISALSGGLTDSLSKNILGKELPHKGVKIAQSEEGIVIDIYVIVNYGFKIPQVAWDIQESVKKEVELMTESTVKAVNIHVQGVDFSNEGE